jgi:hypothetical protein
MNTIDLAIKRFSYLAIKYISDLCDCIQYLYPINGTIIICGDFDFPNSDWSVENCIKQSNLDWLRSYITPLFKKGVTCDPNNYRPVALAATLCKVMESVIKDQLLQYLTSKGIISKKQHAFIKKLKPLNSH